MEYEEWSDPDAIFSSDSCQTAYGGFWNRHYFHKFPYYILEKNLHISALEIIAIILCLRLWASYFKGKRIVVFCDNKVVCQVINSGKASCEVLQNSLREICFIAAFHEFEIRAEFLEGSSNRLADILSRWHLNVNSEAKSQELTGGLQLQENYIEESFFQFVNDW